MTPTKTQVLAGNAHKILDLLDNCKKRFDLLETRAETYRRYVNNPGGSTWEGKTAQAAKDRARDDNQAVADARDTVSGQTLDIANTVNGSLAPPLKNAQDIIHNCENPGNRGSLTVNEDLSITYNPPDGTSQETIDKNTKIAKDAEAELKADADKWWAAEELVAGQIGSLKQAIAAAFNNGPLLYHVPDAFIPAPGEIFAREPGETHTPAPGQAQPAGGVAGTGAPQIDPAHDGGIGAADLGEIIALPNGKHVAILGDAYSGQKFGEGLHYPSAAVEVSIDPQTGQLTFGRILTGHDPAPGHDDPAMTNPLFPIPDRARAAGANNTLPAGSVTTRDGKTYLMVVGTNTGEGLNPRGGSWLVEVTNDPGHGWKAIEGPPGSAQDTYREWKPNADPGPNHLAVGTRPDSAPTQISGYQASNGHIYIAADAFDRSQGITMYEVDNPADITNRDSWKPWTGHDWGQAGPDSASRAVPLTDRGVHYGEISFREVAGHPVLSGWNGATGGTEIQLGNGAPSQIFDPNNSSNTVVAPAGTWPTTLTPGVGYPQNYGGFIVPGSTLDNIGVLVSQWNTRTGETYTVEQFQANPNK